MPAFVKNCIGLICITTLFTVLNSCSSKKMTTDVIPDTIQESIPSLQISNLFMDHMVLQQNDHVSIFGKAGKHQIVTVTGSWGENARTFSDDNGEWLAKINTPSAGGPFTIDISQSDETVTLNDVMIGEVWIASGQSNMQMPLKGWPPNDPIDNSAQEIANGNFPQIRMITIGRKISTEPTENFSGKWEVASPETVSDFSATAYFFARRLHQELNVPVGIIHTSWGGTVAEAWVSKEKLKTLGDFDKDLSNLSEPSTEEEIKNWFADKESRPVPTTTEGFTALDLNDENASISTYEGANEISLPGRFDVIGETDIDGAFWLYKEIIVEDLRHDYSIEFGAIDDIDATFVNGERFGSMASDSA